MKPSASPFSPRKQVVYHMTKIAQRCADVNDSGASDGGAAGRIMHKMCICEKRTQTLHLHNKSIDFPGAKWYDYPAFLWGKYAFAHVGAQPVRGVRFPAQFVFKGGVR
jgi:hypothetical protein